MTRRNLLPVAAVAMTLLVAGCSNSPKPQAHAITPAVLPSVAVARPSVSLPATEPGVITDERAILAAQRALGDLGYKLGKADGVEGDARKSSAELGREGLDLIVAKTVEAIRKAVARR